MALDSTRYRAFRCETCRGVSKCLFSMNLLCSYCISNMQSSISNTSPSRLLSEIIPVAQFHNQRLERCIKYFLRRRPDNTESNTRAVDTRASASLKFNFLDWTANSRSLSGRCSLLIRRLLELESDFAISLFLVS